MLDIVTMKFGARYPAAWANRLALAAARFCSIPHRVVCFTDDPVGLHGPLEIEIRRDLGGWWNHLWAFSGWTPNRQMLLDVDDLLVGSLDELAAYDGPHALNSDVYRPHDVDGGFQLIPPRAGRALFEEFMADPNGTRRRFYSDKQLYIARINNAARVDRLFPGQVVSYKVHCQGRGLPDQARVVCFHGQPKHDAVPDRWVTEVAYAV